ncbi:amino-acid N-acetyltransferase [Kitasatospora sp. SolWspMP-SS2h]|uniref:GNAT family N-acetyltransferase n=1 Tax=Kitasatospora sp. SolWspMP-SS2h TaxID=1305729 RepID=UPI000DB94C81|nr:GNAT family N-acetyltransferase [Kitasatospora sp. SolWspMP-SS2h]RAJ45587.1 amino-acid N-acetyltransferase [Kitasatospora sp. SolWspMP-SS2h]
MTAAALSPVAVRTDFRDARALYELSLPFIRSGALRARTPADYRHAADTFLVVRGAAAPDACAALRVLDPDPGHPPTGVLHNLCVRAGRQGLGLGGLLITAVLAHARRTALTAVVTATTGDGAVFRHHGFAEIPASAAPPSWSAALDPARGSRVYRRLL